MTVVVTENVRVGQGLAGARPRFGNHGEARFGSSVGHAEQSLARSRGVASGRAVSGLVARYAIDVPFEDDWNVIPLASNALHHSLAFHDRWAQYGSTRLFVPNLVFAASGRFDPRYSGSKLRAR